MSADTFNAPFGFAIANGQLYVSDCENDRVLSRPVPE